MRRASFCAARIPRASTTFSNATSPSQVVRTRISLSSSRLALGTSTLSRKRSNCASGSGNVPSCSIGFCVAITKKGRPSACVTPPALTVRSCIASSNADCVFGLARFTSSASTSSAKIGPRRNSMRRRVVPGSSIKTFVPVISAGMTSGVNCTRENRRPVASASERISNVLPSPGTPSRSMCPSAKRHVNVRSTTSCCPTMRLPTSVRSRRNNMRKSSACRRACEASSMSALSN